MAASGPRASGPGPRQRGGQPDGSFVHTPEPGLPRPRRLHLHHHRRRRRRPPPPSPSPSSRSTTSPSPLDDALSPGRHTPSAALAVTTPPPATVATSQARFDPAHGRGRQPGRQRSQFLSPDYPRPRQLHLHHHRRRRRRVHRHRHPHPSKPDDLPIAVDDARKPGDMPPSAARSPATTPRPATVATSGPDLRPGPRQRGGRTPGRQPSPEPGLPRPRQLHLTPSPTPTATLSTATVTSPSPVDDLPIAVDDAPAREDTPSAARSPVTTPPRVTVATSGPKASGPGHGSVVVNPTAVSSHPEPGPPRPRQASPTPSPTPTATCPPPPIPHRQAGRRPPPIAESDAQPRQPNPTRLSGTLTGVTAHLRRRWQRSARPPTRPTASVVINPDGSFTTPSPDHGWPRTASLHTITDADEGDACPPPPSPSPSSWSMIRPPAPAKTATLKDGQNRASSLADFGYADPDQDPMASVRVVTGASAP